MLLALPRLVRYRLTRLLLERLLEKRAPLPLWAKLLLPERVQAWLSGLERIDATPLARAEFTAAYDRRLAHQGRELCDFATGAYLGLERDANETDLALARHFGLRNGWSRASGTTPITRCLELALAQKLGFEQSRLAPSISLLNLTVFYSLKHLLPVALVDSDAHLSIKRGVKAAYGACATFPHNDLAALERALRRFPRSLPKLVAVDGLYSMRGEVAPVGPLVALCRRYGAVCYVDDAHGFGVLGDRGLGVAEALDAGAAAHCIYVASFSKAYSNPLAFIAFPARLWVGIDASDALTFCGPPSNFHAAVALRHLDNTERYRGQREHLARISQRLHAHCRAAGLRTLSSPGMPLLCVGIDDAQMEASVAVLERFRVFAKVAIFPVARRGDECLRFSLTALHGNDDVARLQAALDGLAALNPAPQLALAEAVSC